MFSRWQRQNTYLRIYAQSSLSFLFSFFPVPHFHLLCYLFYIFSPFLWETTQNDPQVLTCRLTPTQLINQWSESSQGAFWMQFLHADIEDSDQTARMHRLIWVFVGHTCQKGSFQTLWLIFSTLPEAGKCFWCYLQTRCKQLRKVHPNKYLKKSCSPMLTLITLSSAFKHISLILSSAYK